MELELSAPYIISNIVAIFIAIAAMVWPTLARVLLGIILIAAAVINFVVALIKPDLYLGYVELTSNNLYRDIILGPFSHHIQRYVFLISFFQLCIGVFTCYKGELMKLAMIGGIIFLLGIAPLEIGSAFPATMILALAYVQLLQRKIDLDIFQLIRRKLFYQKLQ